MLTNRMSILYFRVWHVCHGCSGIVLSFFSFSPGYMKNKWQCTWRTAFVENGRPSRIDRVRWTLPVEANGDISRCRVRRRSKSRMHQWTSSFFFWSVHSVLTTPDLTMRVTCSMSWAMKRSLSHVLEEEEHEPSDVTFERSSSELTVLFAEQNHERLVREEYSSEETRDQWLDKPLKVQSRWLKIEGSRWIKSKTTADHHWLISTLSRIFNAFRADHPPMETWSSWPALVDMLSTDEGWQRALFSETKSDPALRS